jgi:hypothetical protein
MNRTFKAAIQAPGAVGEGEGLGRNFLDCMWAHLPWFAIVMALAIVAIVLTVYTAVLVINPGVVLFTQAFWALFWQAWWALGVPAVGPTNTIATIGLIIMCIVNPNF